MAKSLNKWQGIGNLTRDVESKHLPNGDAVCNFSVACNESWKDRNTGENVEKAEFINIVAFRKLAEICGNWLTKGSKVYVEGKLQTRKWQDKDGQDRWTTEIVLDEMLMLGGRDSADGESHQNQSHGGPPNAQSPQSQAAPAPVDNDFDNDIPF